MNRKSKSAYLSDHWASEDGLNFDVFRLALMDILENADTPLTIGVFGSWGSGKTSLLRMLEKAIDDKGSSNFRTMWFTAWKYDKQESLWRAFILRVIDGLYPKEDGKRISLERLKDKRQIETVHYLDHLAESLYQTVSWQGEEAWALDLSKTAKETIKLPIWLALHLAKLGDAAKDLGIQPDLAEMIGRESQTHYMQQLSSIEQFENSFEEALSRVLGEQGRLIVFVDDLDRCLPEKAIEILESIKLFLNVPQTIFVLGMDREVMRRGIEHHYGIYLGETSKSHVELPISGDVYLQKLVQLPFTLPPLNIESRQQFIKTLEDQLAEHAALDPVTLQVFARGVSPTPRQVKRALNAFYLLRKIAEIQEEQGLIPRDSIAWPLLAKTVLIQSQWPELFARWRQYYTVVQQLEDYYRQHPLSEEEMILGPYSDLFADMHDEAGLANMKKPLISVPALANGILGDFLTDPLLAELLRFPNEVGEGRLRAWFSGLTRSQLQVYLGLAGRVEKEPININDTTLHNDLITQLRSGDPAILHETLALLDEQESDPNGPAHQTLSKFLLQTAQDSKLDPVVRSTAAFCIDELGYLPDDLFQLVLASDPDLQGVLVGKYPVTNLQYERFLKAADFCEKRYWSDFPAFDEHNQPLDGSWGESGWLWMQAEILAAKEKLVYPRAWNDIRFGIARKTVPVVAVTWFEANAYCKWLLAHWDELPESRSLARPQLVRLPTNQEWIKFGGGNEPETRHAWQSTGDEFTGPGAGSVVDRANVREGGVGATTPVWMYPSGASPLGVMDMSGNVWEWQANHSNFETKDFYVRGGAWGANQVYARIRSASSVNGSECGITNGFRIVAVPSLASNI